MPLHKHEHALHAVPAVPLLASIVHGAKEDFFDALVGRLQRLLHEQKVAGLSSDAVGQVLRALLHHDGWHSNRVWAGIQRLSTVAGVGERTVRRVLHWLRTIHAVREVTGEELYGGPGPHQWPAKKRRGKLETTCYDLSGLIAWIPATLRAAVSALLLKGNTNLDSLEADVPSRNPSKTFPGEQELPPLGPEFADPFADPVESHGSNKSNGADQPFSPSLSLSEETKQTPVYLVSHIDEESGKTEEAPSPKAPPSPFTGPNLAAIKEGARRVPSPRFAPGDEETALRGLSGEDIRPDVVREMLASKGARWCLTLLAYGQWMRRKKEVRAGWFVRVWEQSEGKDSWPDAFLNWYAKKKAYNNQARNNQSYANRAKENNENQKTNTSGSNRSLASRGTSPPVMPSVSAKRSDAAVRPPARMEPRSKSSSLTIAELNKLLKSLPANKRSVLEARAREELQCELGCLPVGPLVDSRVRQFLAKEHEDLQAADDR